MATNHKTEFGIVRLGDRYAVMSRGRATGADGLWNALYTVGELDEARQLVAALRSNDKKAMEIIKARAVGRPIRITYGFDTKDD